MELQKDATEVHIWTWLDSTLAELKSIIQGVWSPLNTTKAVTMYHGFIGNDMKMSTKMLGTLLGTNSFEFPQPIYLSSSGFKPGDIIFVTIDS